MNIPIIHFFYNYHLSSVIKHIRTIAEVKYFSKLLLPLPLNKIEYSRLFEGALF